MERNFIYTSETGDGYRNLATDEWFLDHVGKNDLILYFYQNENRNIFNQTICCNLCNSMFFDDFYGNK